MERNWDNIHAVLEDLGFKCPKDERFFSSPEHPGWIWVSLSLLYSVYQGKAAVA